MAYVKTLGNFLIAFSKLISLCQFLRVLFDFYQDLKKNNNECSFYQINLYRLFKLVLNITTCRKESFNFTCYIRFLRQCQFVILSTIFITYPSLQTTSECCLLCSNFTFFHLIPLRKLFTIYTCKTNTRIIASIFYSYLIKGKWPTQSYRHYTFQSLSKNSSLILIYVTNLWDYLCMNQLFCLAL